MKKKVRQNLLIKNDKKRKNLPKKFISKKIKKIKKEIKNLDGNNWTKIILICVLLFLRISFNNNTNEIIEKVFNNNIMHELYDKDFNGNSTCDLLDPIHVFNNRLQNQQIKLCENENTKHICYNDNSKYKNIFFEKNGILCIMENIIIDPSKSKQGNFIYKGPVDEKNRGLPLISKGFLNAKCKFNNIKLKKNNMYDSYLNSWHYDYNLENEELEELAPGKTVFLLSRNQDSPNFYHGNCEIINVISMMYLFNLSPENIQVLFMESIEIPNDPFYDIYKNMLSKGGEPIYLKNLKKKYKISKAIHVPLLWDSPAFSFMKSPKCDSTTKTYKLYNDLIDKYMNIKPFIDTFISDNKTAYYPDKVIKMHEKNIKFKKIVTIQWRKVWPEGRIGQTRLLGNGPQIVDKLASVLPDNILIRLINTASLSIKEQISLAKSTDYFIGIHGAGLALSIFMPKTSILHEIKNHAKNPLLTTMSSMSGHKTYSDILKSETNKINGNTYIFFDEETFSKSVLDHMKKNNFFD